MNIKSKRVIVLAVSLAVCFIAASCKKETYIDNIRLLYGVYWEETLNYTDPQLHLYPDGIGQFTYSSASSDLPAGKYEMRDNTVILTDDYTGNKYTFKINGEQLIFSAENSAEIWDYGDETAKDGMIFSYSEELSEYYLELYAE